MSLLVACLADDFTGATDALEALSRAGLRTVMGSGLPRAEELAGIPGLQALVVATVARSLAAEEMSGALRPVMERLRDLRPRHVFYKVCSTFDSSPETGSVGRVIDLGAEVFCQETVPVIAGAPALGRFCVFGNLFATASIAEGAEVQRLDRHPVMSRHPVTPMDESDLRRHLGRQTARTISLLDVRALEAGPVSLTTGQGAGVLLCDLLSAAHYPVLGAMLDGRAGEGTCFSVGSSGLAACLGAHWAAGAQVTPRTDWPAVTPAAPVLVASGSCSAVTARQIQRALDAGFASVPLTDSAAVPCLEALRAGRSVVLHSCRGPDDPRLAGGIRSGQATGTALAAVVRGILTHFPLGRIVFAGGDSTSHAITALGLRLLEMKAPLTPGAPLCQSGGLELVCKGGQAGPDDFFLRAAGALSSTL